MANSVFSLVVLLSAIHFVAAQRIELILGQGSSLTPTGNSFWLSPSGLFAFGFYQQGDDGYKVGIFLAGLPLNKSTVVWTANRDEPPVSENVTLILTSDGNLVLQQQYSVTYVVKLDPSISSASMLDSGNFVLYDSNREKIWQSFTHPTDTILPGQILSERQELVSSRSESDYSTGRFRLIMQSDSDLVQYPVDSPADASHAYWATGTYGIFRKNVTLNLDSDGRLFLLKHSPTASHDITEGFSAEQRLYLMKIDPDGILRMYSFSLDGKGNSSSVVWESSDDKCDPKGLCGLNGICSLYDKEPKCECPPGFDYVSPADMTAGCERRNYTADSCNDKEPKLQYSMVSLEFTEWRWDSYDEPPMNITDHCKTACLEDCKCEVAIFEDGKCRKQRLPLRYGKRSSSVSTTTYIKVNSPIPRVESSASTELNSSIPQVESSAPTTTRNCSPKGDHEDGKRNGQGCILDKRHSSIIPVLSSGIGSSLVVMFVLVVSYNRVRHRQKQNGQRRIMKLKENFFKQNGGIMLQQLLYKNESTSERAKIYTEEELKKATNDYNENNVIGQGGSGTVYMGVLADTVVAIKKSKLVDGSQIDQFVNEIVILSQIKHPNVVKLLGCCLETPVPLLVYEFVTNNTLFHHIHDEVCASSIPWDMRLKIATETAGALAHMHSAAVHIIHRDFKTANILLDDEYTAKVSDFGISRLFSLEQTRLATLVQGTLGYIDPEYFHSGILTQKSDVYSFGVVLAELLTGAKVVSFCREEKDRNLGMYFLSALEDDRLFKILEPLVREKGNAEQLEGAAEIAKKCLSIEGAKRPTMKEVEEELVQLRELNIENYTSVEIGSYAEDIQQVTDEVIQYNDSNAITDFDCMKSA